MKTTNKKLVIISDFDDTLANKYVFNEKDNSHKPIINKRLVTLIEKFERLGVPFIIATSRGFNDPNLNIISKLSNFPIIVESGGGLYSKGKFKNLVSKPKHIELDRVRKIIKPLNPVLKKFILNEGYDLIVRLNRFSSIEFRIQDKQGVGLISQDIKLYKKLESKIKSILGNKIGSLQFKRGGSSLNIVPIGVSKTLGIKRLFSEMKLDKKICFIVGIGDSEQDREIFRFSDLSICVGESKIKGSDKHIPGGSKSVVKFVREILKKYE